MAWGYRAVKLGKAAGKNVYAFDMLAALALRIMPKKAVRWLRTPPYLQLAELSLEIWRERPDIRAAYDLATQTGRQQLARWLVFHGFGEMCLADDEGLRASLALWQRPWPALPVLGPMPITWLMREAARGEGFTLRELRESAGQLRLLSWYFRVGMAKYGWVSLLTDAQAAVLAARTETRNVPLIVGWLWDAEPAWRTSFSGPDDPALYDWLYEYGGLRWPVLADPRLGLARRGRRLASSATPFGVNLVGHAHGRFGIGEDVRMAAHALLAAGVPFTIRDIEAGPNVAAEEHSVDGFLSDAMPYRFTMFCTTGMEAVRAVHLMGRQALDGRILIGFWPWELPEFPAIWHQAYNLVDEVWASSRYTHDAYARSAPVPLRHMPMAVTTEESNGLRRADFGLPAERFLFIFAYDALSNVARKNPEACLAAFDLAFPHGDEPAGLVIKGLRVNNSPAWQALRERSAQDPRLFLIDESLERGALLDLYRACDCLVSLHRAEGFGRNIAECMALGLPVIVTAHSGNMDFTRSDTAALVPVRLRKVASGEYPFGTGQAWAEPDLAAAAALMRRMSSDEEWRSILARKGQQCIAELYAPDVVGRQWAQALHHIAAVAAQP